jgi:2-polyprenyl-3-methyl-5-hydroxy-6-metoxy-1,4-benzoquinol methylase
MDNERIRYTACPLCQSAAIRAIVKADLRGFPRWHEPLEPSMIWMKCEDCEHVFTEGYFTDEALSVVFETTNEAQIVGLDFERQRHVAAKMVERVTEVIGLPDSRLWLDVGFGSGSLLMTAKEFGFEVFGVDLRKKNVDSIAAFGIAGHHGSLESARQAVTFGSRPTVISMADVVEHEPFPLDSLRAARALIADSGVLLISMPNAGAPLWDFLNTRNDNPYWAEIEHYHNFTRESLYSVLRQTGFRPIRYAVSERYRCCMEVLARAV